MELIWRELTASEVYSQLNSQNSFQAIHYWLILMSLLLIGAQN